MAAKAAHQDDLIDHSMALLGMLVGGCAGIAIGCLCALSGGSLIPVIAGIAAAGAGGALAAGNLADLIPRCVTGKITTGSTDVFIGADHKPAPPAGMDLEVCPGPPPATNHAVTTLAQGSHH